MNSIEVNEVVRNKARVAGASDLRRRRPTVPIAVPGGVEGQSGCSRPGRLTCPTRRALCATEIEVPHGARHD
jgi:hypothetical protein